MTTLYRLHLYKTHNRNNTVKWTTSSKPIKKHPTNNKVYISWVIWPRIPPKINQTRFSKHITPWKRGYTKELLKSKCQSWEVERVLATESKLRDLRNTINFCHESKVKIKRLQANRKG